MFNETIKTLPLHHAKDKDNVISGETVFHIMTKLHGLFKYLIHFSDDTGYSKANPVDTYITGGKPVQEEPKEPFTTEDLTAIFTSNKYVYDRFKHSYQYWIPLIAVYTGMRVNEISQLYCCDVVVNDDIAWLDINGWYKGNYYRVSKSNDKPQDKMLKNPQSARLVPLHPVLKKLGFIEYVNDIQKQGNIRIFPELKHTIKGYSANVSMWFSKYKKECGILSKTKSLHCMRKNFTDRLLAVDTPDNITSDLLGWKKYGGSMLDHYASKMHISKLALYAKKVRYGDLDLSHLLQSKFARKQKR
jgi:integrase